MIWALWETGDWHRGLGGDDDGAGSGAVMADDDG